LVSNEANPVIFLALHHGYRPHRGESDNLRDAAHETFHALTVKAKTWERDVVHAKLVRKFDRAELWMHEMQARAVEQLVCKRYGIDCGPLDEWVFTSIREAMSHRLPFGEFDVSLHVAQRYMDDLRTGLWVRDIAQKAERLARKQAKASAA
jgi:hypothetical protein